MNMNKILSIVFLFLSFGYASGQHFPLFSQYMFNGLVINPAFSYGYDGLTAIVDYKNQWSGSFEGAPVTLSGTLHSALKNEKISWGAIYMNDRIGLKSQNDLSCNFAYRINTGSGLLGMGISGGFSRIRYDASGIITTDQDDPAFAMIGSPQFYPKIGLGMYYHTEQFFAGISAPQWLLRDSYAGVAGILARTFFLNSGYRLDINRRLYCTPSILLRAISGSPVQTDLNITGTLDKTITAGISYRMYDSFVFLIHINMKSIAIGYSYDYSAGYLNKYTSGSHELMLSWRLGYGVDAPDPKRF